MKTRTSTSSAPVSEKNTKQEILQAYQELTEKLHTSPVTPEIVEKVEHVNTVVRSGLDTVVDNVQQTLTQAVTEMTGRLDTAAKALEELRMAADVQRKRVAMERDAENERREREAEEYKYDFGKRKTRQEEELAESRRKVEADLAARKEELRAQQEELADLRGQVKTFEARLTKAVNDAVTVATKELKVQFDHEKALAQAAAHGATSLLTQQVELLTGTVSDQKKEIDRLNKALVDASAQVTRIAERAVSRNETVAPTSSVKSD